MSERTENFPVRLPATMVDALRKLAERNDRTAAAEIRIAIRQHLQTEENQNGN